MKAKQLLKKAINSNNLNEVVLIISSGIDIDAILINDSSYSALHLSVDKGYKEITKLLIEKGANINQDSDFGTPLRIASKKYKDIVELLIENGADVYATDDDGNSVLHKAVLGQYPEIAEYLIKKGANINAKNNKGETPLHSVAFNFFQTENIDMFKLLIEKGADVYVKNNNGRTVLDLASISGFCKIVKFLIENKYFDLKELKGSDSPLLCAANSIELFKLLIENGADVDATDNRGNTVLHKVADGESKEIVELLIDKGLDINAKNEDGTTPLHNASLCYKDNTEVIKLLIAKGADVNATDNNGDVPLYRAIICDYRHAPLERFKYLIEGCLYLDKKNKNGETATSLALKRKNNTELVNLLKEKGAITTAIPFEFPKADLLINCPSCKQKIQVACQNVDPQKGVNCHCHYCGYRMFIPPTIYDFSRYWHEAKGTALVSNWESLII